MIQEHIPREKVIIDIGKSWLRTSQAMGIPMQAVIPVTVGQ
jgi:hypothetical protein